MKRRGSSSTKQLEVVGVVAPLYVNNSSLSVVVIIMQNSLWQLWGVAKVVVAITALTTTTIIAG